MAPAAKLPIVYVRGYAGNTAGIDKAVTDPFYGFNEGSTHIRIGADDEPSFYQFESPLLRLHLDEGYHILVDGGQELYLATHETIPPDSIWIHRFYDTSASTWGVGPHEFRLETAAQDLLTLIETLKEKSGAPGVHLVAHSMGGLVCRCLIQKIIPDLGHDPADYVGKLFTYGTPTAASPSTSASAYWSDCVTSPASMARTSSVRNGCTTTSLRRRSPIPTDRRSPGTPARCRPTGRSPSRSAGSSA